MDEVIHIQGPRMGLTYIQAGSSSTISSKTSGKNKNEDLPLGVELPWVHFQVKRLGRRELAVEVGVVDLKGREGIVRCSSFQVSPSSLFEYILRVELIEENSKYTPIS